MTKDRYYEICETLGTEPLEDEIPVEYDDFPTEVKQIISIYYMLRDDWSHVSGAYLGKDLSNLSMLLEIYGIEEQDRVFVLEVIAIADTVRSKMVREQLQNKE